MQAGEILIPLIVFAALFGTVFVIVSARNRERMAMIEKGYEFKKEKKPISFLSIKTGIFFIGVALGLFLGYLLKEYTIIDEVIAFFSMVLLFGGISLVVNHFIALKLDKKYN